MSEDLQHINLQLDVHTLSLNIQREQEPFYRNTASMLNRCYQQYQRKNPNASTEKLWMYVALQVAVNLHSDARDKNLQPIEDKLQALTKKIQETIHINS